MTFLHVDFPFEGENYLVGEKLVRQATKKEKGGDREREREKEEEEIE